MKCVFSAPSKRFANTNQTHYVNNERRRRRRVEWGRCYLPVWRNWKRSSGRIRSLPWPGASRRRGSFCTDRCPFRTTIRKRNNNNNNTTVDRRVNDNNNIVFAWNAITTTILMRVFFFFFYINRLVKQCRVARRGWKKRTKTKHVIRAATTCFHVRTTGRTMRTAAVVVWFDNILPVTQYTTTGITYYRRPDDVGRLPLTSYRRLSLGRMLFFFTRVFVFFLLSALYRTSVIRAYVGGGRRRIMNKHDWL